MDLTIDTPPKVFNGLLARFFVRRYVMANLISHSALEEKISSIIAPSIEDLGFELVRVRLIKGEPSTLQIMADGTDHEISIDECSLISRDISTLLDVEDPIAETYVLEVSSPGIDRPLTRLKDFIKWRGYEVQLETNEMVNDQRRFKGKIYELLSLYFNKNDDSSIEQCPFLIDEQNVQKIRNAKDIILDRMIDPPSLDALALEIGLPLKKLKQGFKQVYGDTVFAYLLEHKMQEARRMLDSQKYNVNEVGLKLGYSTASHFITAFKKKYGTTPKKYLGSVSS